MANRMKTKKPIRRAEKVSISLRTDSLEEAKQTAVKKGYIFSFSAYIQALVEADLARERSRDKRARKTMV